ncbi:hypothetical protein [Cryobacterium sp. PH29-G1]|uniref:hypothetical protein n=1 Tax=Cryobacterium sp. PH29-G1 TaxID=3046211 RepID=UPI0024B8DC86|nr:hypothetical protein [Cryobacterium sp. PH29-G1]MDJ0348566.1 hypothetical protein [Cryobacterium sp. PH29-G1]
MLLLPSTASTAPSDPETLDHARSATLALTCLAAIGGYPALSAPLLDVDGAPLGLCLVGHRSAIWHSWIAPPRRHKRSRSTAARTG